MSLRRSIVLLSGGLDSTTVLALAREQTEVVMALSFDYGQRHKRELEFAAIQAYHYDLPHKVINLQSVTELFKGSALTDQAVDVPQGHYAKETMAATIVPNRNSIMLNIAVGVAIGQDATLVYAAMHAGDHPVYPDCRPAFIDQLNKLIDVATETNVTVAAPFIYMPKDKIVKLGSELGVRYEATWSCYEGGEIHCGRCGTCVERAEAFYLAGVKDPTVYADNNFWKEEVGAP